MLGALFPGQGSQSVGMSQFLYDEFSIAREVFEEASDALSTDMKAMLFEGPDDVLMLTENTQPAILLSSYVTFKTLNSLVDLNFTSAAGHSIGEYGAFVTSGTLRFSDALRAVRTRGQQMQKAVPAGQGGMVAMMGASPSQANEICQWAKSENSEGGEIAAANFNAPGQIVLSGHAKQIEFVSKNAKAEVLKDPPKKLRFIPLKVSAPFHCSLMSPAEDHMRQLIEGLEMKAPSFPIVQNFDGKAHSEIADLKENLIRQISGSVLWVDCIETLKTQGCSRFVELGNGKVLSGLMKKIDPELTVLNINSLEDIKELEKQLN
ncbi:MAG: ACP S-malonyltransferase [Pseudomonadota bacterium]